MILAYSKTAKTVSLVCIPYVLTLHNKDTILAILIWVNIMHYSSLYQYFFKFILGPNFDWKFLFFSILVC